MVQHQPRPHNQQQQQAHHHHHHQTRQQHHQLLYPKLEESHAAPTATIANNNTINNFCTAAGSAPSTPAVSTANAVSLKFSIIIIIKYFYNNFLFQIGNNFSAGSLFGLPLSGSGTSDGQQSEYFWKLKYLIFSSMVILPANTVCTNPSKF
jgi:hypothetical protein